MCGQLFVAYIFSFQQKVADKITENTVILKRSFAIGYLPGNFTAKRVELFWNQHAYPKNRRLGIYIFIRTEVWKMIRTCSRRAILESTHRAPFELSVFTLLLAEGGGGALVIREHLCNACHSRSITCDDTYITGGSSCRLLARWLSVLVVFPATSWAGSSWVGEQGSLSLLGLRLARMCL